MSSLPLISSHQNSRVRDVRGLREARRRRKSNRILVDGAKEICSAAAAGFELETVYFAASCEDELASLKLNPHRCLPAMQPVTEDVMKRLSYGQQGIAPVAVTIPPATSLKRLTLSATSRILVLDRTEKPGNVGACLRTAAATGVDAVVLTNPICELFNPNAIRASRGAIFRVPLAISTPEELAATCSDLGLPVRAARVDTPRSLWDCDLSGGFAVVFGNEAQGLGGDWQLPDVQPFTIQMHAATDSLNLSISCAVTLYESNRQRARAGDSSKP